MITIIAVVGRESEPVGVDRVASGVQSADGVDAIQHPLVGHAPSLPQRFPAAASHDYFRWANVFLLPFFRK